MLTKKLLRYRVRGEKLFPRFLDVADEDLLSTAEGLLDLFRSAQGMTEETLLENSKTLLTASPCDAVVGRGFEKLLLDRTEFEEVAAGELTELRRKVFQISHTLFANNAEKSSQKEWSTYRAEVAAAVRMEPEALERALYSDLPMYSRVTTFRSLTAAGLLHRYNVAQVQGLLLDTASLKIRLPGGKVAAFRRLFKYIRFYQLLADLKKCSDGSFEMIVDGPLSLFVNTQKYGLRLASFFPALLEEPRWEMEAEVSPLPGTSFVVKVSHESKLQGAPGHFSAYEPEELKMFQSAFAKLSSGWSIAPADEFLQFEGEQWCFPDFVFKNAEGKQIYLEIFHPWHAAAFQTRLAQLEKRRDNQPPLLIGIAKKCCKDEIAKRVEASSYFSQCGFVFREMPLPEAVRDRLTSFPL